MKYQEGKVSSKLEGSYLRQSLGTESGTERLVMTAELLAMGVFLLLYVGVIMATGTPTMGADQVSVSELVAKVGSSDLGSEVRCSVAD